MAELRRTCMACRRPWAIFTCWPHRADRHCPFCGGNSRAS